MRKFVGGFCCLIVALQVLIAVPLVVCTLFYCLVGEGGPLVVEVHTLPRPPATIAPADYPLPHPVAPVAATTPPAPPRNVIPAANAERDNPILQARQMQGSPLAGTVLEATEEEELFLTALTSAETLAKAESAALNAPFGAIAECQHNYAAGEPSKPTADPLPSAAAPPAADVEHLLSHLYAMAELDEQSSNYERADRWRALARDLRRDNIAPQ